MPQASTKASVKQSGNW